jgi:hypothetical protein
MDSNEMASSSGPLCARRSPPGGPAPDTLVGIGGGTRERNARHARTGEMMEKDKVKFG